MLFYEDVDRILSNVKYVDASGQAWVWYVSVGPVFYLQVQFIDPQTGEPQHGRKWLLSNHMTVSEVVLTAWKAVHTAEEHEARERFTYKGAHIFGPHLDVETLALLASKRVFLDLREGE